MSDKSSKKGNAKEIVLNNKIKIFPENPIEKYSVGTIKAYEAKELSGSGRDCYALICDNSLLPRARQETVYRKIANPHMCDLMESGTLYWPPNEKEHHVMVYDRGLGTPMSIDDKNAALGMSPHEVKNIVMPALIKVLVDCHEREFCHGNIRLSNIYRNPATGKIKTIMLGDCLAAPYGYHQPAIYQTIPIGIADPIGKGRGTMADDVYAFGVCIAMMLRHSDPAEGLTDDEMILEKIKHGSYAALTGKDRFTGATLELLRGVLHDDPRQRWNVDEIVAWNDGVRLSPKQAVSVKNAPRPLIFMDKKYNQIAPLSFEILQNKTEAIKIIENGELVQWLERALDEKEIAANITKNLNAFESGNKGKDYEERLISGVLSALSPRMPIHYKQKKIMPDAMGVALVQAVVNQESLKSLTELFTYKILNKWLDSQIDSLVDIAGLLASFEACEKILKKTKIGHGLERCIYVLNPYSPCLSPILKGHIVNNPEDLLIALNEISQKGAVPNQFIIDRHIAAFLMEREPKTISTVIYDMDVSEDHKKIIASLVCLSNIQARYKIPPLHYLAKDCADRLAPVYARYHDKDRARKMKEKIDQLAEKGQITNMARTLNDPAVFNADMQEFTAAMVEYEALDRENADLLEKLSDKDKFNAAYGGEFSAIVCSILALLIMLAATVSSFKSDTFF